MDQHIFVAWCRENYEQLLMDPTSNRFEDAHYPWSKKKGDKTIDLHYLDHALHGLWQSEEEGEKCFFESHTQTALYKVPNYWPLGWFEACDLYDKWSGHSVEGRKWWHHRETGKRKLAFSSPGPEWELGLVDRESRGTTGLTWWWNPRTGERRCKTESPGDGWSKGSGPSLIKRGRKLWFETSTLRKALSVECPGPGWEKGMGPRT